MRNRFLWVFLFSLLLTGIVASCIADEYRLTVDGHEFVIEVADTPETRRRGLMERRELSRDAGMLFVFPDSAPRSFWMKNTVIPLSIAYIDENLVIREIYDMEPLSLVPVASRTSARFALEVNQGVFADLGIVPGDRLQLSARLRDRVR